uniref:Uncharacterized protein n=1 Tax=Monopterus albus TaxID=43700 RepID=A0A3Q3JRJ3_MONAL
MHLSPYSSCLAGSLLPSSLPQVKIPGGRGTVRDHSLSVLLHKDEKLTVTQAALVSGNCSLLRFHYQLSERRSTFWDTALTEDGLFLEIPSGPLINHLSSLNGKGTAKAQTRYTHWHLPIIKTFHYMGFEMVKPGNPLVPARPDLAFMAYSLDNSSSEEE